MVYVEKQIFENEILNVKNINNCLGGKMLYLIISNRKTIEQNL